VQMHAKPMIMPTMVAMSMRSPRLESEPARRYAG
jgi:hypothetical protein